jgi:hypothetical protein
MAIGSNLERREVLSESTKPKTWLPTWKENEQGYCIYTVFTVQAYQTSQYVLPCGGIFLGKWRSSFAGSSGSKMNVQSACPLNTRYIIADVKFLSHLILLRGNVSDRLNSWYVFWRLLHNETNFKAMTYKGHPWCIIMRSFTLYLHIPVSFSVCAHNLQTIDSVST